ncbi:MAG: MexH family multidrug efflux RND transporter periplasmic adaptor subunit [Saprospiraceae bacterium]|nr:MAG: MexH family multidrug efflux RND transporter periplasmic adaptor subunit [Saprospiraceae bacterium]
MKYIKPIIAVIAIGGIAFWIYSTLSHNKAIIEENAQVKEEVITEVPVRVAAVEKLEVDNSLKLTGNFVARKELNIIAETQGRITNLKIVEGQNISKGLMVAKIDDTSIQSQLATANASLEKAKKDVERYERLVTAGAVSQLQYEDVKLSMENAKTNVTAIQQQLKYTIVHSPMTGIIKELKVEEGSFATPGSPIATVVDVSRLKMVIKVPETEIIRIKKGQKVEIQTEVYPDHIFNGQVSLISVQADEGRKYEVEIELPNHTTYPLKAGMYGTVKIEPASQTEFALYVPRKSIEGSVKNPQVYLVQGDNVKLKTVKVGEIVDDKVIILEGLKEGDQIVTTGQINLEDGKRIKIIQQAEPVISQK